ncbi:MAG: DeoR/GlpR family DNA-binding transcription regulator [Rhodovibrionaceae bacterium]
MFQSRRQSEILQAVRLSGSCSIGELAERFEVSGETIRRTVKPLVSQGLVRRVHGGVTLPERLQEPPFHKRMQQNSAEKQRIARKVAEQVDNGDTLILDCGSTTTYVARALSQHRGLVVVTNSAEIARTLATNDSNKVFMAGGELRSDDTASLGPEALSFVGQFQVRHAILSLGAIDDTGNMMVYHLSEADFSRAVMARAENVIVAVDHSKFGRKGLVRICEPGRVDSLVTDAPPPEPLRGHLDSAEVEILVA